MNDSRISRRSLNTGVAWTLPAVTIAAAAPAFAGSTREDSQVFIESNIANISSNYNSSEAEGETTPEKPSFNNNGTLAFYKTNTDSFTVSSVTYSIVITSPDATFSLENGTNASVWSIPTAPSSTTTLNGTPAYVYDFAYTAPSLPLTVKSTDGGASVFGTLNGNDTIIFIQVRSGDGITLGSPFQGKLTTVVDGQTYTRTSNIGNIVQGRGDSMVIGDEI